LGVCVRSCRIADEWSAVLGSPSVRAPSGTWADAARGIACVMEDRAVGMAVCGRGDRPGCDRAGFGRDAGLSTCAVLSALRPGLNVEKRCGRAGCKFAGVLGDSRGYERVGRLLEVRAAYRDVPSAT